MLWRKSYIAALAQYLTRLFRLGQEEALCLTDIQTVVNDEESR
jgi:hypothetical protein